MRTIQLQLLTMAVAFVGAVAPAAAADDFKLPCPANSYLTGFEGRIGALIDQLKVVCAHWDAERGRLASPVTIEDKVAGRSDGGNPARQECPAGWVVADASRLEFGRDRGSLVLQYVSVTCRLPLIPQESNGIAFGSDFPSVEAAIAGGHCRSDEVATGVRGLHEKFIFDLMLICGPAPKISSIAAANPIRTPTVPNRAVTRIGRDIIVAPGAAEPPPPPPPPMVRTTSPTDVYRRTIDGKFVRTDNDLSHFLPKHSVWPLLAKEGGWWKLELKTIAFAPGGEGWVAADDLEAVQ